MCGCLVSWDELGELVRLSLGGGTVAAGEGTLGVARVSAVVDVYSKGIGGVLVVDWLRQGRVLDASLV